MRAKEASQGVTVNAVAGTHVVVLGFDLSPAKRKGCLGFAIQREDHTEHERYWMSGMKTFGETDPKLGPGGQVSSRKHPFQSFQWADYSAKPDHDYTYSVIPLYGTPAALKEGPRCAAHVQTEPELGKPHSVFFNRGAVASQEYARRFQNVRPDQMTGEKQAAAYKWLSRGLYEALLAFIARAKGKDFGLHAAIYEFQWPGALAAFGEAHRRGAEVRILYDAIKGGPGPKNETQIADARIKSLCEPRTTGKIMHNKFVVLTEKDRPVAVWTGSTNLTDNGIFGHLNCGHIVEDRDVAAAYLEYWEELRTNPDPRAEKAWVGDRNANPPTDAGTEPVHVFSPRSGLSVLEWYAVLAASADTGLFMTFAFGMHDLFKDVYRRNDDVLRFALMDKESTGRNAKAEAAEIERIRRRRNVVVAVGNSIETNQFDRWLAERDRVTANVQVRWVHTKFMLVDPLSTNPTVITGSANFSGPSTDENNENMLVIRGDTRVADIYFGEFVREYSHYAFREAVARREERGEQDWQPATLSSKPDWSADYFDPSKERYWRRRYFAQTK